MLFIRPEIDVTVAPIRNPQYVTMSDGTIRNTYDIRLRNKHGDDRPFRYVVMPIRAEWDRRDSKVNPTRGFFVDGRFTPLLRLGQLFRGLTPASLARKIPATDDPGTWPAPRHGRRLLAPGGRLN